MAITADKTIKPGDSSIISAIREYFQEDIQKKVYEESISRNLDGAVTVKKAYGQGFNDTFQWTVSEGVTTTATDRYDIADSDLKLPQVEYSTDKDSVKAEMKGGVITEREDVMMDQEAFIMGDIQESIVADLTKKENQLFASTILDGTAVAGTDSTVDLTTHTARYGVNQMRAAKNNQGKCRYILMHPNMTQSLSDFLSDASKAGDNRFLRENVIGMLHGAKVVDSTYIEEGKVVFLGDDSVILYERMPYKVQVSQDEVDDLIYKFALKARFGMKIKRAERCLVGTYNYEVLS